MDKELEKSVRTLSTGGKDVKSFVLNGGIKSVLSSGAVKHADAQRSAMSNLLEAGGKMTYVAGGNTRKAEVNNDKFMSLAAEKAKQRA